jgi:hypothetical protein
MIVNPDYRDAMTNDEEKRDGYQLTLPRFTIDHITFKLNIRYQIIIASIHH